MKRHALFILLGAIALFFIVDMASCTRRDTAGSVIDRKYSPEHYWTTTSSDGKGHIMVSTHYCPPSWYLKLREDYGSGTDWVSCSNYDYYNVRNGAHFPFHRYYGGLTGWHYSSSF